jgi:hypothetical protein
MITGSTASMSWASKSVQKRMWVCERPLFWYWILQTKSETLPRTWCSKWNSSKRKAWSWIWLQQLQSRQVRHRLA